MGSLRLTLPLPPSINNLYVTVGRRRVLSKEAKSFKKDVRKLIDRLRLSGKIPPTIEAELQGSLLGAYLTFHFETPFRRDLDGGLKIALDSVAEALGIATEVFDDRIEQRASLIQRVLPPIVLIGVGTMMFFTIIGLMIPLVKLIEGLMM